MDSVVDRDELTAPTERSVVPRPSLSEYFAARFARMEEIEESLKRGPSTPAARQRLALLHRAKFSTWLDIEALKATEKVA